MRARCRWWQPIATIRWLLLAGCVTGLKQNSAKQIKLVTKTLKHHSFNDQRRAWRVHLVELTWACCKPETPCLGCHEGHVLGNLQINNVSKVHARLVHDCYGVLPLLVQLSLSLLCGGCQGGASKKGHVALIEPKRGGHILGPR
jgi:hypothetical protein